MVKISAFSAIRPIKKLVSKVTTQAYSSYSKKEIGLEIKNNPYSYLNIIGNHQTQKKDKRFHLIRKKIHQFQDKNILKKDTTKKLYIYQQIHKKNRYLGLICAVDLKEYGQGKIKIHEHTILERELLFAQYLEITKIHAEPVLITYDSNENYIQQESMQEKNKLYDFKTKDGVKHIIWEIKNQKEINRIKGNFNEINNLYIADGHHRMASSFRCQKNGKCLAYIIPKNELDIKPFHRAIKITKPLLTRLRDKVNLKKQNEPNPLSKKIQCYIKGQWYEVQAPPSSIHQLLINHLLNHILKPIFKIHDERTDKNVRYISGDNTIDNLINNLTETEILFFLNTIKIKTIINLANNNQTTPAKSTFILPKLPSGLIIMDLLSC